MAGTKDDPDSKRFIDRMFSDQQRQIETVNTAKRKHDAVEVALIDKIDACWSDFLNELRALTDEFNSRANPHDQIPITTPDSEPNAFALRKDGEFGGQVIARVRRDQRYGDVARTAGRTVQKIDFPLGVLEHDLELALMFENGDHVDSETDARWLSGTFFRWTLGLIDEELPEGEPRI